MTNIIRIIVTVGELYTIYILYILSVYSPFSDRVGLSLVDVSALSICIVLCAFVVIYMCLLYVSLGSRVSLSMFGLMFMGSVMLSICSSSCVLHSAGSGVKRVHVVLSG